MLRCVVATALTGLVALAGPAVAPALAAASSVPTITLSSSSVRPGITFSADTATACPSADGEQDVDFSFTDSAGLIHDLGTTQTDDDGSWSDAQMELPVSGLDEDGAWQNTPVSSGAGTLLATCLTTDDSAGSDDVDNVTTQTYALASLSVKGSAPQLTVSSTTLLEPGDSFTVTPNEACPAASSVEVDLIALFDDNDYSDSATAETNSSGVWSAVRFDLPDDVSPGDYGVTATCSVDDEDVADYDGVALGVGTVKVGAPDCSGAPTTVRLTGTYTGNLTAVAGGSSFSLPATIRLAGAGPWNRTFRSAVTDEALLTASLSCPAPKYDVDVTRTGVHAGHVRARVCNTSNVSADFLLQVKDEKYRTVDDADLDAGDCIWMSGGKVAGGDKAAARVLLNPDGASRSTKVIDTFTVRRSH